MKQLELLKILQITITCKLAGSTPHTYFGFFGWDARTHLGFGWDARTQKIFMEELEQWLIISGGPCKMIEEPLERVFKYLTYFGFFEIGITAFLPARATNPGQFLQSPKQKPIFGPVLYHPNLFFLGELKQ